MLSRASESELVHRESNQSWCCFVCGSKLQRRQLRDISSIIDRSLLTLLKYPNLSWYNVVCERLFGFMDDVDEMWPAFKRIMYLTRICGLSYYVGFKGLLWIPIFCKVD